MSSAPGLWAQLVVEPLSADAREWSRHGFASGAGIRLFLSLARYGGFRATLLHRVGHWAHRRGIGPVPAVVRELNHMLHGIELTPATPIGPGLYMPHTVGTVITASRIGAGVELQGGITIGQRTGDGFPTIGDGVVVSCGARVLGAITVGPGAVLGANTVVIRDVPAGALAIGVPARYLLRGERARQTESQSEFDAQAVG